MHLATLLLADGRFPAGGHVHSGGVEAAVADGRVHDVPSLAAFVRGRVATAGFTDAALAAATWVRVGTVDEPGVVRVLHALDAEADARVLAPPLRAASRRLGRQLLRAARSCWPSPLVDAARAVEPDGIHQPVALGVVGRVAGLDALSVAHLALHHAASTPAQAGVRLLGLDPFAVAAAVASVAAVSDELAREARSFADGPLVDLPACSGPVIEIAAVEHAGWDARLFTT